METTFELDIRRERIYRDAPNKSQKLLLPLLKINKQLTDLFGNFEFVNTFTVCESLVHEFTPLYLLFETEWTIPFMEFENRLARNQNFIESIDYEDYVLSVFKIPNRFLEDYVKVTEGKCQFTSPSYKVLVGKSALELKYSQKEETLIWER